MVMSCSIPALVQDVVQASSSHTSSRPSSWSPPCHLSFSLSPVLLPLIPAIMELKRPRRSVRLPPRVTPRCISEVAPSLWEGRVRSLSPHQTCASMTPKCPWSLRQARKASTRSLPPRSRQSASRPLSRLSRNPCSSLAMASQQRRLAARKASANATNLGGARLMTPALPRLGTKTSAASPKLDTVCQSVFRTASFASSLNPH
mmetsp:Transcript_50430/g.144154  ORF Transcript_50430/g.144154 Transcript_50430/m.144154 type:complete len:203 (+) Transcript_50430:186-794(+)